MCRNLWIISKGLIYVQLESLKGKREKLGSKEYFKKQMKKFPSLEKEINLQIQVREQTQHRIGSRTLTRTRTHIHMCIRVKMLKIKVKEENLERIQRILLQTHSTPNKILQPSIVNLKYWGKVFSGEVASFHYIIHPVCEELTDKCQVKWS